MSTLRTTDKFAIHTSNIDNIISEISTVGEPTDITALQKLKSNFEFKTADFYRTDRKLNIGVIGQVKAGKSSFLNSLLFSGQAVLPKASTPKTATLTKIEYSTDNKIEVEYYSIDEWDVLEQNAKVNLDDEIYISSRELVKLAIETQIDVRSLLAKGKEIINFDSYDALIGKLNDYVGENGKFTAIVKSVTLYLDREELEGISIVDTPGLNDPIVSRTIRTKDFIELCDIVFFLSQAGSFLDKSDWTLLSTQLPQKGAKKLVLIASKYDSAIRDILRKKVESDDIFDAPISNPNETDNIPDARAMTANKLNARAKKQVELFVADLKRREASEELIKVISNCSEPLLVSSMCYNMANKPATEYDKEELNVYNALLKFSDSIADDIALIGNYAVVKDVYDKAVSEKEELLAEKAKSFIPMSIEEISSFLIGTKEREEKRLAILKNSDLQQLSALKKESEQQINAVKSDIVSVIGETAVALETKKTTTISELRKISSEYAHINDRTGIRTETSSHSVSDSKWYNPFSWGKSHREYSSYQVSYSYLDVSDATDNIHKYANTVVSKLEAIFSETANITAMKRKLLGVIVNNFDTSNQNYDANFFRLLTEKTLNEIEFPIMKLDFNDKQNEITAKFSGEITSSSQKTSLNQMLSEAVQKIFDEVANVIEKEIRSFKVRLDCISGHLTETLLANIQKEFDDICVQFNDKEMQMNRITEYIRCLSDVTQKL